MKLTQRHEVRPEHLPVTRRRFLAGLGAIAGAGALAPLWARVPRRIATRYEVGRPLMGTWVRVVVRDSDPRRATRSVESAFAAMQVVNAQMSLHLAGSDLNRVNRASGETAVPVPPALLDVVERARDVWHRSGGGYDVTVLPIMRLYGFYGAVPDRMPTAAQVDEALERVGTQHLIVDRAAGTLGLARHGAGLDLGSIGKGWAVDRALDAVRAHGVSHALVDAGGNVGAIGEAEDGAGGWSVGLLHPVTGRTGRTYLLRDAAIATSGNSEQSRTIHGARVGHLFDARRGRPASGHLSVTVMARLGVDSDALSTTAYLLGPDRFRGWAEALDVQFLG
jgi:thiamine biosynthesis lipoprotein